MKKKPTNSAANESTTPPAISNTSRSTSRSRSWASSTLASSARVRSRPTALSPRRTSAALRPPSGAASPGASFGIATSGTRLASGQQQPDDESHGCGDADRGPRIVVDVVVGRPRRVLRLVERLPFQLLQPKLGREQLRLDLRAQVAGPFARFVARALEQILGLAQHGPEIIDDPVARGHARLLVEAPHRRRPHDYRRGVPASRNAAPADKDVGQSTRRRPGGRSPFVAGDPGLSGPRADRRRTD